MIKIYTLEENRELRNISVALREKLLTYFEEIARGIVEQEWQAYNVEEVGPILVIEDEDTIDVLDEFGLMQGNRNVLQSLPEFVLVAKVGNVTMMKIIWVCNDFFGLSVYYPSGKFVQEFDDFLEEYIME